MLKKLSFLFLLLFSFNVPAKSVENISTFIEQWQQENQIPAVAVAIKITGGSLQEGTEFPRIHFNSL